VQQLDLWQPIRPAGEEVAYLEDQIKFEQAGLIGVGVGHRGGRA
jgi:hypothetical protein